MLRYLLEGYPELDEFRRMNNEVIRQMPGTAYKLTNKKDIPIEAQMYLITDYVEDNEPAIYGRDVWFHYYSIENVMDWAQYFEKRILRFLEIFEKELKTEQSLGRDRFNKIMGQIQQTTDIHKKIDILSEYVTVEADQFWRTAAEKYLVSAQSKVAES